MVLAMELGVGFLCNNVKLTLKEECATQRKSCKSLNSLFIANKCLNSHPWIVQLVLFIV
jgi:hypothetical protein